MQIKTLLMEIGQRSAFGPQILDHPAADILRNIIHFQENLLAKVRRKTRQKHCISRIFDSFRTAHHRGAFAPTTGSAFAPTTSSEKFEDICEILRKFKLFARFSQGFHKVFFRGLLRNTHSFAAFRTFRRSRSPCD